MNMLECRQAIVYERAESTAILFRLSSLANFSRICLRVFVFNRSAMKSKFVPSSLRRFQKALSSS